MKTMIAVFSYERYPHLRLSLGCWLLKASLEGCTVSVLDDGSTDGRIGRYLRSLESRGQIEAVMMPPAPGGGDSRIGQRRRDAVNLALKRKVDYLLMLDDDILVGSRTIQEAVRDLTFLLTLSDPKVGALSLHHPHSVYSEIVIGGYTYSLAALGGEANLLIPRASLEQFGREFGPHPKGFADTFLKAMLSEGYVYLSRCDPPYQVQHIGIGPNGSVIDRQGGLPFWVTDFYRSRRGEILSVERFDRPRYAAAVEQHGARQAPEVYRRSKG